MPKFKLLILDAGVVIKLFELGVWGQVLETCDVHLSKIVAEQEANFHSPSDAAPNGQPIDLDVDIKAGRCTVFECSLSQIRHFLSEFDDNYAADLDPGEAESLAWLFSQSQDYLICSGDAIVYRVLGLKGCYEQGISLEEILGKIGLTKTLPWQYTSEFRECKFALGSQDQIQDRGLK